MEIRQKWKQVLLRTLRCDYGSYFIKSLLGVTSSLVGSLITGAAILFRLSESNFKAIIGAQPLIIMTVPGKPPIFRPTIGISPFIMSPKKSSQMPKATAIATAAINAIFVAEFVVCLNCEDTCKEKVA